MTANDVYTYTPKQHHCHEGLAIENDFGRLIDWFWGGCGDSMLDKRVSPDAEDLTLIGNLGDYEMTARDGRESSRDYAPEDRLTITSQHGLQRTHYIRKGARPDLSTRIENARQAVRETESAMIAAKFKFEYAQSELAKLEAQEPQP